MALKEVYDACHYDKDTYQVVACMGNEHRKMFRFWKLITFLFQKISERQLLEASFMEVREELWPRAKAYDGKLLLDLLPRY